VAYAVLPDMEQELQEFLAAHPSLTPLIADRVSTELPTGELTCLTITALGGTQPWPWEAVVEFSLSAWGGDKGEANLIARTAAAAAYDLVGQAVTGGHVTGAAVRLAPLWSPDEDTNRPRYRVDLAFTVMP
jgi:hypothetical protein